MHFAGVYAEICEFANEWVSHDLECKSRKRSIVVYRAFIWFSVEACAFNRRDVQRGREVVEDCVQQELDAFVLVCGSAEYREQCAVKNLLTDGSFDFVDGQFLAVEVFFHQFIAAFSSNFADLVAEFFSLISQVFRDFFYMDVLSKVVFIHFSLHCQQVDDAFEGILLADWKLHWNCLSMKADIHGFYCMEEVSAYGIHLVDECNTRNTIVICLSPYGFGLGLDASLALNTATEPSSTRRERSTSNCEVYVLGVDDIDSVTFPVAGGSSRRNCDAAFLFLYHPVHGSSAIMNFPDLMVYTGIKQDTFRGCCLAGIDMSMMPMFLVFSSGNSLPTIVTPSYITSDNERKPC